MIRAAQRACRRWRGLLLFLFVVVSTSFVMTSLLLPSATLSQGSFDESESIDGQPIGSRSRKLTALEREAAVQARGGSQNLEYKDVKCSGEKCSKYLGVLGIGGAMDTLPIRYCEHRTYRVDSNSGAYNDLLGETYFRKESPVVCGKGLVVTVTNRTITNIDGMTIGFKCSLASLERVDDKKVTFTPSGEAFAGRNLPRGDFFRVTCFRGDKEISSGSDSSQETFVATVDPEKVYYSDDTTPPKCEHCMGYNVAIIGFDSMSQVNFLRNFPKSHSFITKERNGITLSGYNVAGSGAYGSLLPILTGKRESETPNIRKGQKRAHYVDHLDLLWKIFEDRGYATLFAEDDADLNTFNNGFHGFEYPPTTHYMRPFWMAVQGSATEQESKPQCLGGQPRHRVFFEYLRDFYRRYSGRRTFSLTFHKSLSGTGASKGQHLDEELLETLQTLTDLDKERNTIVVLLGNHGVLGHKAHATRQGKDEARTPLMIFAPPNSFFERWHSAAQNVTRNTHTLTTPFDLHETLRDILDSRRLSYNWQDTKASSASGKTSTKKIPRGLSLFQELPIQRTCADAGVDAHWCGCYLLYSVGAGDQDAKTGALKVLEVLNEKTGATVDQSCSLYSLNTVLSFHRVVPKDEVMHYEEQHMTNFTADTSSSTSYYQVVMETGPSGRVFESTLEYGGGFFKSSAKVLHIERIRRDDSKEDPRLRACEHAQVEPLCECKN